MAQNNFPTGIRIFAPSEKAPNFIKGNVLIESKEFIEWIQANTSMGKCRLQIKESQKGGLYFDKDTYVPKEQKSIEKIKEDIDEILEDNNTSEGFDGEVINAEEIPF